MKIPSPRRLALTAALLLLPACETIIDVRGNLPQQEQLEQIKVGTSTRDDVQSLLGSPSNVSPFGEEAWHYVSAVFEHETFFEPKQTERKVISIVFDRSGVVRAVETKGMEDGKNLMSVDRETPTAGKEMTLLEQLMGNVGRFTKEKK